MAKSRREKSGGWFKRERTRFGQEAGDEPKASGTQSKDQGIRWSQSIVLRSYDGNEEEVNVSKDSQRPE
jgi:hypothetical protein